MVRISKQKIWDILTREEGTDTLYRNVGINPTYALQQRSGLNAATTFWSCYCKDVFVYQKYPYSD
jgi:hypothetical protein